MNFVPLKQAKRVQKIKKKCFYHSHFYDMTTFATL